MYDHTSPSDMVELARQVDTFKNSRHPAFYAGVLALDLMRMQPWFRFAVFVIRRLRNMTSSQAWYIVLVTLQKHNPNVMGEAVNGLTDHIVLGKDRADPNSCGGLNGVEVAKLVALMKQFGWQPPVQRVALRAALEAKE